MSALASRGPSTWFFFASEEEQVLRMAILVFVYVALIFILLSC